MTTCGAARWRAQTQKGPGIFKFRETARRGKKRQGFVRHSHHGKRAIPIELPVEAPNFRCWAGRHAWMLEAIEQARYSISQA